MASAGNQLKLIVGIDYGTTYSGISFALSNAADHKDVITWTKYPGAFSHSAEHCVKAPTRIALKEENADLRISAWGYEVEPGMKSHSETKLLLDKSAQLCDFDDQNVYKYSTNGPMALPEGKTAKDVATEYLKQLYNMFEKSKHELFGSMNLDELPVDFWLTVPANWGEKAKILTKCAAMDAGFGRRLIDQIKLISEPEAAAHYTLKSSVHLLDTFVMKDSAVMICDCGGGTVDITTYEIEEVQPRLKLGEIAVGNGKYKQSLNFFFFRESDPDFAAGKCGATFVDRNFRQLMADRFGEAFTSLDSEMTGPGSAFMNQLEQRKKDFSCRNPSRRAYRLSLHIPKLKRNRATEKYYERRSSSVLLTHEDLQQMFDPAVKKVLKLIANQVDQAAEVGEVSIDTIALDWCTANGIRFTTPVSGGWSAIVSGAVLRGLEGCIVREKKCRRHYGFELCHVYVPAKHSNYDRSKRHVYTDKFDGLDYLTGFVQWQMDKGSTIHEDTEISYDCNYSVSGRGPHDLKLKLYSCNLDNAPDTIENPRIEIVGHAPVTLGDRELATAKRVARNGRYVYRVEVTIKTRLNDDSGHLIFRVLVRGLEVGRTTIELDD
ncbi:Hsp70 family protein [Akanthomyces lecanii RCEF 1005]|uniref:Hsp70 family protein n=1 Tax=Akanthomyces lecanii RCEF 1005 TaxID=1081108 RepID=A0A168HCA5_CORDF|nr:Hsp70 family protein [Akanthomyces lecanii RCEF 1005]